MSRKRGRRFRKAIDAQEQLEQIEERQRKSRRRKSRKEIDSIKKSTQRETNFRKRIRRPSEAPEEFDLD